MKRHLILIFIVAFAATNVIADMQSEQAIELAVNGVVGTNADGEQQTTVVDENGNLKMVPVGGTTKSAPSKPKGMVLQRGPGSEPGTPTGPGMGPTPQNGPNIGPTPQNGPNIGPTPQNGPNIGPTPQNGPNIGSTPQNGSNISIGPTPQNGPNIVPTPQNGPAGGGQGAVGRESEPAMPPAVRAMPDSGSGNISQPGPTSY